MIIRDEAPGDAPAIHAVNEKAFGRSGEADLVDALRAAGAVAVSMVGEIDGAIVAHVLFSTVTIESDGAPVPALSLGPVAVLPEYQKKGWGTALIRAALDVCREKGGGIVTVLGHPEYYPRFGFATAKPFGISCEFEAPEEAFMVLALQPGALNEVRGTVRYHRAFHEL